MRLQEYIAEHWLNHDERAAIIPHRKMLYFFAWLYYIDNIMQVSKYFRSKLASLPLKFPERNKYDSKTRRGDAVVR